MRARDEPDGHRDLSQERSAFARYSLGLAMSIVGVTVTATLYDSDLGRPLYAPLIGAVALTAWYGGIGPGLAAIGVCWTATLWLLVEPTAELGASEDEQMIEWGVGLTVALVIVAVSEVLRRGRRKATSEAVEASSNLRRLEALDEVAAALAASVSATDVARALTTEGAKLVEADGAAVALVEGDELVLQEPIGVAATLPAPADRIALTSATLLSEAVRDGVFVRVGERQELAATYPDTARRLPSVRAAVAVPLRSADAVVGALGFVFENADRLGDEEAALVETMAGLANQALERATRYESERTIAETLQRSVLPASLPRVDGLELAARYLPGTVGMEVGGDWFDALRLADGRVGLVVGDVVGKGVYAAASMGQLRNALRAFSLDNLKPASALARLDRLADDVLETTFATLAYVLVDPVTGMCRLSAAGHPPPLAAYPNGRVELLEGGRGLPLGTGMGAKYRQDAFSLPAGSTLLLYSDGLVERRGRSIDEGLTDLRNAVHAGPSAPERIVEHVLDRLVGDAEREDDIALLAARFLPVAPHELDLDVSRAPRSFDLVRDALRAWLSGIALPRADAESLLLATWEAFANACEHAIDPGDLVRVHAALLEDTVRIVVQDSGGWKPPAERPDRGLGLRLMRLLATSVDVETGEHGTRVTIEKSLAQDAGHGR